MFIHRTHLILGHTNRRFFYCYTIILFAFIFSISLIEFSREVLEQIFACFTRLGGVIESILSQCLGPPPNFLEEFNHDRSWGFMAALHYFPATETENSGITEHEEWNCITFVFKDEAGGLEVRRDGELIPVIPTRGSLVVNIGDVMQVKYIHLSPRNYSKSIIDQWFHFLSWFNCLIWC